MPLAEIFATEHDRLLRQKARLKKIPLTCMFELTYRCNFHCVMCYNVPQDKQEMTTEEVRFILDELAKEGCLYLTLTGGEIMTRKDIFEILGYAVAKGFQLLLKTNASLLTLGRIDRLQALGIDRMDISFHGSDAETFDGITQVKGSYDRTKQVVEELARRKFRVSLSMVAMRANVDQITGLRHFARSLGVHFSYNTEVSPRTDGDKSPLRYRLSSTAAKQVDSKQVPADPKRRLEFYRRRLNAPVSRQTLFTCGVGTTQVVVGPYGEARLCIDIEKPTYSIFELGLKEAWRRLVAFVEGTDVALWQCPEELRPFCTSWCPARGLLHGGDLYDCNEVCQQMARVNQEEYQQLLKRAEEEGWLFSEGMDQRQELGCEFEGT